MKPSTVSSVSSIPSLSDVERQLEDGTHEAWARYMVEKIDREMMKMAKPTTPTPPAPPRSGKAGRTTMMPIEYPPPLHLWNPIGPVEIGPIETVDAGTLNHGEAAEDVIVYYIGGPADGRRAPLSSYRGGNRLYWSEAVTPQSVASLSHVDRLKLLRIDGARFVERYDVYHDMHVYTVAYHPVFVGRNREGKAVYTAVAEGAFE